MIIYNSIIQGTPEWHEIRKGKMTASNAAAIGNCGAGLKTYVRKIINEMRPGYIQNSYSNENMQRGNELEPIARQVYEFETGTSVKQIGFASLNDFVGCSPDGLVGFDGGIEIKARGDDAHWGLICGDAVDSSAIWQMQMNMFILERKWWDFVSYNPNYKQSIIIKRFYLDTNKVIGLEKGFVIGESMIKELMQVESIKIELNK